MSKSLPVLPALATKCVVIKPTGQPCGEVAEVVVTFIDGAPACRKCARDLEEAARSHGTSVLVEDKTCT